MYSYYVMNKPNNFIIRRLYTVGTPSRKSLACIVPKEICRELGLEAGVYVMVNVQNSSVILTPLKPGLDSMNSLERNRRGE